MSRHKLWRGISPVSSTLETGAELVPDRIVKLCSVGAEVVALATDHSLYYCDEDDGKLAFRRVPGLLALDLASSHNTAYIIDTHGRLFKSNVTDLGVREEISVREEARCCPHGFRTSSFKVKFRSVVASEFGTLLVSSDGQLWGCGSMPQISLDSLDIQKITFFEGRTVYGVSLGSNFAAVITRRNMRRSGTETESEDEEEVFASACAACRALAWPVSPASEACPLGVQLSRSSEDTSSATAPPDPVADAHSNTEDSSQSTDEEKLKTSTSVNQPAKTDDIIFHLDTRESGSDEESSQASTEKANNIFINADAAKQFLSRQLSWVSAGEDYLAEYTEKPTRIIKENVSNLTNLVYEGVRTVGDKVAILSRHVSGSSDNNEHEPHTTHPRDLADSLLYSCTSSYHLDDLHFSMSTIASEKNADNANDDKINCLVKLGRNILGTELWTWGVVEHGQLGIGDTMKRVKPMTVTALSGFGLQKVCCGKYHCTALTLDGRMFGWGNNHYHQIGFESREDRSSPLLFAENSSSDRVRDMLATEDRTLVYTHQNNLFYMGKYPDEFTEKVVILNEKYAAEDKEVNKLINVSKDEEDGCHSRKTWQNMCYHWRICSAGKLTYSFVAESPRCSALPDLSIAQKILEELLMIYHLLNKPFLKRSKAIETHTGVYETVCELYSDILHVNALNVLSMWQYTENHIREIEISIIKNCEQYIYLYKKYLIAICNLITISGFSQIANIVDVPSSIYNLFSDQLPTNKQKNNKKSAEAIVTFAFTQPLTRLSSYKCIIKSLLRQNTSKPSSDLDTEKKLNEVLLQWDALIEETEKKKRDAEITRLFWETSGKVIDQYKTPERRLLRESRSRPLSLVNAGRFSNHWFVLLSDVFLHISGSSQVVHPLSTVWVEALTNIDSSQNVFQLVTPEETINVSTATSQEKTEWVQVLQTAIKGALKKVSSTKAPAVRTASYTFTNKSQFYKDAKYHGRWLDGKIHGNGRVEWLDGKVYIGQFQQNAFSGNGRMEIPGVGVYEGQWKDNLQNGYGVMKYTSGDLYEGYFKDGLAHGHGVRRQGDFTTSTATIYLGEWSHGVRQGYGVMDDIGKGEKYLGSWSDNKKHGCGLIVTLDGIYYEGVFMQDVLTGHGVMVFEDGTHYEGEFRSAGVFSGKGVLTLSSGDKIEGALSGAWTDGVKISNATLRMNVSDPTPPSNSKPNSFGKLCVAPHQKWNALFHQCYRSLGIPESLLTPTGSHFANGSPADGLLDNKKIWQNVAVLMSNSHKDTSRKCNTLLKPENNLEKSVDCLEVIPKFGQHNLDLDSYTDLKKYLQKACETSHHPVGQLALRVTSAFNTTYGGVRVHPLLLSHAVRELQSVTARLYRLVRLLFPALPPDGADVVLPRRVSSSTTTSHTHTETDPIDGKFWPGGGRDGGSGREQLFAGAVETLQQLKTTFSPIEKLLVIRSTFQQMTESVQRTLGDSYLWNMDELFPVFHFVVVRARILQLGSEIHFVEDFLEPCLQHGELGIMFTTLKACYFQILQEKVTITT